MRYLTIILFLLLTATATHAQQFGTEWMTSPSPNDSSCLWFRRTFVAKDATERPVRASVCVATASRFILYVNGRNVSTALYSNPQHHNTASPHTSTTPHNTTSPYTTTPSSITFDVTRFLRPDSNTVAVLACPATHQVQSNCHAASPQMSISFFGTTGSRRPFAYSSADGWLCRQASTSLTIDGELMDGRADDLPPAYGDMAIAQWHPATIVTATEGSPVKDCGVDAESLFGCRRARRNPLDGNAVREWRILRPRYFDVDRRTIAYDFAPGFCGFVRVTLRGCRRGERIRIGNLTYICSGDIDEQAFTRFAPLSARKIIITGDRWFRPEQVQEVEAVCI